MDNPPASSRWRRWLATLWRTPAFEREVAERTWTLEREVDSLRIERHDLRRILNGMGEGVLAVDRAGVVVYANPGAVDLLGLDAASAFGSHMFVAVPHPAICDAIEDVMRSAERTRTTREVTIDRPDGERTLTVSVRPLRTAGPEVADSEGAIAVVRDISELRRLERSRQDFFTNVSHELKTPITAIRGAIETVLDDDTMPDDVRARFLDGARRHSLRLGTLVTDLLALARLEDSRALQRAPVVLAELVAEAIANAEAAAARAGIELRHDVEAAPAIEVDEEAMLQALSNLVDNAIAHSDSGAVVLVSVQASPGMIELSVQDGGAGIPAHSIDRIFERFYRVDAARSRARGGTGIGLSIVKHVAQAHGGSVEVRSELGRGSTFTIRLPVSPSPSIGT